MLVFDLERQNRALCELFQQKLPNQPTAHYQVPVTRMIYTSSTVDSLLTAYITFIHNKSSKSSITDSQPVKVTGEAAWCSTQGWLTLQSIQ